MSLRADVYKAVLNGFKSAGDLIFDATLGRETTTVDPATDEQVSTTATSEGEALFTTRNRAMSEFLAGLAILPDDRILYCRGFTFAPEKGDRITIAGITRDVIFADNLLEADALYLLVAR